jgi:UDP-N-acetylmuramoyl-tripeptide--D-alanyl-D-alanine ligase
MPHFKPDEIARWSDGTWEGSPPSDITHIVHDSRKVGQGNLFLAIRGEQHDGHGFIEDAARCGAVAAMVDHGWQRRDGLDPTFPIVRVANTHAALSKLADGYRRKIMPALIGVTGSAGKSTAKEMTAQLLSRKYQTARTMGNWNNDIGLPLSLLAMEADTSHGVFEVGTNHPGEIEALCRILHPDQAIVTNVAAVHIANFGSVEAIALEKGALLRALPSSGHAFLNSDLPCFEQLKSYCTCPITTVGTSNRGDYHVDELSPDGMATIHERSTGIRMHIRLPVPGVHNLANALMALAVARHNGLDCQDIEAGLAAFESMPMRWQTHHVSGAIIINDAYNANPLSMRAAISTFLQIPAKHRWIVLGGMLELGDHETREHETLGQFTATTAQADGLIVIGPLGRIIGTAAIQAGMNESAVMFCPDTATAAQALSTRIAPDSAVLLKASRGFRLETIIQTLTGAANIHE